MEPWKKPLALGAAALVVTSMAACSSEKDSSSGAAASNSAVSDDVQTALDEGYEGTFRALPTSSPEPARDKNVWVISLTLQSPSPQNVAAGIEEAGALLGWETTVFDGESNPTTMNDGIRQAIAAGADGIILNLVECAPVSGALRDAREAGIKIFGAGGNDCEASGAGPNLFDAGTYDAYPGGREAADEDYARFGAAWVASRASGDTSILQLTEPDYPSLGPRLEAFRTDISEFCSDCNVDQVEFALTDLGTSLRQKVESGLLQHPDTDFVVFPYDAAILLGGSAAIQASPRRAELQVLGGECLAPNVELIRSGSGQNACVATPYPWLGWASADGLNRVFQNSPQVDSGIGYLLIDAEHNLPDEGVTFDGSEDYQANYREIWGVTGS
jgi:ribose transport system substrate-binding protein